MMEYVEDGVVKIVFVVSEDNDAGIMTKNTASMLPEKHASRLVVRKEA